MLSHCQLALHNPPGNMEVAVGISSADSWADGSVDVELRAAMGVTAAYTERKILVLLYKYCPLYKRV